MPIFIAACGRAYSVIWALLLLRLPVMIEIKGFHNFVAYFFSLLKLLKPQFDYLRLMSRPNVVKGGHICGKYRDAKVN